MKNSIITLAFVLYLTALSGDARGQSTHSDADSLYCLELDGRIMNAGSRDEMCHVELFCRNELAGESKVRPGKKRFIFYLKHDELYTLKLTMKDHLPKIITIDTRKARVPQDAEELYYFGFETSLEQNSELLNSSVAEFPVAILYFNENKKAFEYDKAYTENMKKELYAKAE